MEPNRPSPVQPTVTPAPATPPTPPVGPPASVATPTPVSGGWTSPAPKAPGKGKFIIAGGLTLAVAALVAGGYFGWYLPNTPNRVWSDSINRSGKAFDSVIVAATDAKKIDSYKSSEISGTVVANFQKTLYTGDFDTKFDQTSLDGGLNFTLKDSKNSTKTLSAKVLSELPTDSIFPNIYFQLKGLKTLGLDSYSPGISSYDGKWIVASSAYLKSIGADYVAGDNTAKKITSADIAEVARALSGATKNYLFSTEKDKAVFIQQSFVAREQLDGVSANHYKVSINVDHAKAYCSAINDSLYATAAYKKLSGSTAEEINKDKQDSTKSCQKSVDENIKASDNFDLWVDTKYKLIYKVRIYDEKDKGIYTDLGQLYKGNDQLSLFATYHDTKAKSDGKVTIDTDLKTNTTKAVLTSAGTESSSPYDVKVTLDAKASSTPITITKPIKPTPIEEVLKKLGLD